MDILRKDARREQIAAAAIAVIGEVLGQPGVGAGDHFFAIGGASLSAALVSSQLERELGIDVPIRLMYEHPVIGELADALLHALAVDERR